jgi:hypothetical protein
MPVISSPLNQTKSRKLRLENQKKFLELFMKSGLSHEFFCKQHNLNKNTFKNWVYLHKKAAKLVPHPVFLPLDLNENNNVENCPKNKACRSSFSLQPLDPSSILENNFSTPCTATITHKSFSINIPTGFDLSYLQQILKIIVAL